MLIKQNKHKIKKTTITIIALLTFLWLSGLHFFSKEISNSNKLSHVKTDALVVLTGGSLRLETGLKLLSDGMAKKIFISGVHMGVDVKELLRVARINPSPLDCCIDLDYNADNTIENAIETAKWMNNNGYKSLRLVTANYHMPRSLLEFHNAMPDITIYPHSVSPKHVKIKNWYLWPGTSMLIISEYNKLIFAPVRWLYMML